MKSRKIKIKLRPPRNPYVRGLIEKPPKSGAHLDYKKIANKKACKEYSEDEDCIEDEDFESEEYD
jgi:hypothetical protein